ncbi:hypothetical protein MHU86_21296 [Fragilaria crotonensis]|nr:hypothetical protein MHU86_21296 [Fragilaria crotonensis]
MERTTTPDTFISEARRLLKSNANLGAGVPDRDFRSHFGVSPTVCFMIWEKCKSSFLVHNVLPRHLLWALMFLKIYATEDVLSTIAAFSVPSKIDIKVVLLLTAYARFDGRTGFDLTGGKTCKVTVDGVDFPIEEPTPFDSQWFSHKFRGPGLRYEMAICIQTGDIVWVNGPYKCGKWPDVKIFKSRLMHLLGDDEMVEADRGYRGHNVKARTPDDCVSRVDRLAKTRARARHETVNRRLKQWGSMQHRWRHVRHKHKIAFAAVAVCTQLAFETGERPFQCRY